MAKTRATILSHDGHPLTVKEDKFISEFIKTGNAMHSVKEAGYTVKSASQYGQTLINKPYIASEIKYRMAQLQEESIADATEIMQYFTDVMRGKIADQFGLEASLSERTKAAQELAKRQIDIPNKLAGNEVPEIKITLDWQNTPENSKVTVRDVLSNPASIEDIEDAIEKGELDVGGVQ